MCHVPPKSTINNLPCNIMRPNAVAVHEHGIGEFYTHAEAETRLRGIAAGHVACERSHATSQ